MRTVGREIPPHRERFFYLNRGEALNHPSERREGEMKKLIRRLGPAGLAIAAALLVTIGGLVYAYTAITVTSEVEVREPISIALVEGDGIFNSETNVWDIGYIYPPVTKAITITFANDADGPITLALTAYPASFDHGNLTFTFDSATVEVPAAAEETGIAGTVTVTLTADTMQSLVPGSYSTVITVER